MTELGHLMIHGMLEKDIRLNRECSRESEQGADLQYRIPGPTSQ